MILSRNLAVHFAASIVAGVIVGSWQAAAADVRQGRLMLTSIELENLVTAVKTSGGQVARQEMQGFGQGWSGAQLFWRAPVPVDSPIRNWPHLDFVFNVPADGTYEVVLRHTVAPDFATFRVFLDGRSVSDVDGYAASVAPRARALGSHDLKAGSHQIVVTVFAKAPAATGYAVGLDRLDLRLTASEGTGGGRPQPERVASPQAPAGFVGRPPVANQVTLEAGRRLTDVREPRTLSRAGLDDAARVSTIRALGGIFANVQQVQSTIRWSAEAPVIPGRGYMGGENVFVGAPEPLTIAFRAGAQLRRTAGCERPGAGSLSASVFGPCEAGHDAGAAPDRTGQTGAAAGAKLQAGRSDPVDGFRRAIPVPHGVQGARARELCVPDQGKERKRRERNQQLRRSIVLRAEPHEVVRSAGHTVQGQQNRRWCR